jgi:adenosine deaminase
MEEKIHFLQTLLNKYLDLEKILLSPINNEEKIYGMFLKTTFHPEFNDSQIEKFYEPVEVCLKASENKELLQQILEEAKKIKSLYKELFL